MQGFSQRIAGGYSVAQKLTSPPARLRPCFIGSEVTRAESAVEYLKT
jgi:hypothetical protein